jgi:hypothetical protein
MASGTSSHSTRRTAGGIQLAPPRRSRRRRQQANYKEDSESGSESDKDDDCPELAADVPGVVNAAAAGSSQQRAHTGTAAGADVQGGAARGSGSQPYWLPPWQERLRPVNVYKQKSLDGRSLEKLSREEAFQLLSKYHTNPPHERPGKYYRPWLSAVRRVAESGLRSDHPSLQFLPDNRQARVQHRIEPMLTST